MQSTTSAVSSAPSYAAGHRLDRRAVPGSRELALGKRYQLLGPGATTPRARDPDAKPGAAAWRRPGSLGCGLIGGWDDALVGRCWDNARAAGDHDVAAHVAGQARRLLSPAFVHALAHVVVELVDRDAAVPVGVGIAGGKAFDETVREERPRSGGAELVHPRGRIGGLEGILELRRRRQRDPPATFEALLDVDGQRALRRQALAERAAVAAVEDEHDRAGAAVLHHVVDEAVLDRRRPQQVEGRRDRGEVEAAAL